MISSQFDILIEVPIIINDTIVVGRTDLNGFFQIDIPASVKTIIFREVGLEPAFVELVDNCSDVELVMIVANTYDLLTAKKVDKLRMKAFKKLPEIHKEAFEKGIFKTDSTCYKQKFIPILKK